MRHARHNTTIGELILVAEGEALVGLYFPDHWYGSANGNFGAEVAVADDPLLASAVTQLDEYLEGGRTGFELRVVGSGDEFERRVWKLIGEIPYGETSTYGAMAEQLGDKALARRVGQAVGHNPISIFVPCHRVVGTDGGLTGYAGGLDRKRFLLGLEEPEPDERGQLF